MGNSKEFLGLDIANLAIQYKNKQVSPVEITKMLLSRIDKLNPTLNAYITILAEQALEDAKKAEKELSKGEWRGYLHGVPIGLKDLIETAGVRTTMGSQIFSDYIPNQSATVVNLLKQNGAIIVGKLNTHEFAYGPSGDVSYFGAVRNPYDTNKMTGGSSSGSGAAVSTGMCYGALGTDTGGSIRIPSSSCGIIGMKPSFGRVSKFGVFPLGYTLDHVGPMTRTIRDNAIMLSILAGYDGLDPYSVKEDPEDFTRYLEKGVKGAVIAIPTSFYYDNIEEEVRLAIDQAKQIYQDLGATIIEVDLDLQDVPWAQLMTIRSEAYAVHQEWMEKYPDLYHPEVKERLVASKETKGYEYVKAAQIRRDAVKRFNDVFKTADSLLVPTLAITPKNIGQREVEVNGQKEHIYSALLRLNGPTNLTGFPSLSVPCGFSSDGMPIGMQLIGKHFDEANLYRIGYAFEQEVEIPSLRWNVNQ
ncbi:MAG TPA: amidase [Bacillota bacterium]|nr:amidase [Bacillota bacterium]